MSFELESTDDTTDEEAFVPTLSAVFNKKVSAKKKPTTPKKNNKGKKASGDLLDTFGLAPDEEIDRLMEEDYRSQCPDIPSYFDGWSSAFPTHSKQEFCKIPMWISLLEHGKVDRSR